MTCSPVVLEALPLLVDLRFYQGDDWYVQIDVSNPDGSPADVTDADPQSQIRAGVDSTTVLAEFAVTIDSVPGRIILHLPSADTAILPASAVWDVQLTTPAVVTLAAGKVTAAREVTR